MRMVNKAKHVFGFQPSMGYGLVGMVGNGPGEVVGGP